MKYSLPEYSPFNNSDKPESFNSKKGNKRPSSQSGIPNYSTFTEANNGSVYKPYDEVLNADIMRAALQPIPYGLDKKVSGYSQKDVNSLQDNTAMPTTPGSNTMPNQTMPLNPGYQTLPRTPVRPLPSNNTPMNPGTQTSPTPTTPPLPRTTSPMMPSRPNAPLPIIPGSTLPTMPTIPITPGTSRPGMPTTPGSSTMPGTMMPTMPGTMTPTMPGTMTPTMPGTMTPTIHTFPGSTTPTMGTTPNRPGSTLPTMHNIPQLTTPPATAQSDKKLKSSLNYSNLGDSSNLDYDYNNLKGYSANNVYLSDVSPYHVPLGVPMMPLYGYDNCEDADKDWDYIRQMYPMTAKKILVEVEDECDKLEYDGSCMFDEYPERVYLNRTIDKIFDRVSYLMEESVSKESVNATRLGEDDTEYLKPDQYEYRDRDRRRYDRRDNRRQNWLRDLIEVILFNEILNRRRRYRGRKRWF